MARGASLDRLRMVARVAGLLVHRAVMARMAAQAIDVGAHLGGVNRVRVQRRAVRAQHRDGIGRGGGQVSLIVAFQARLGAHLVGELLGVLGLVHGLQLG